MGCSGGLVGELPPHYVYWQAATEIPTPTEEPTVAPTYYHPTLGVFVTATPPPEPTPPPTPTPYIRVSTFYRSQNININGLILRYVGDSREVAYDSALRQNVTYAILNFQLWNTHSQMAIVAFPLSVVIPEVYVSGGIKVGPFVTDELGLQISRELNSAHLYSGDESLGGLLVVPPRGSISFSAAVRIPGGSEIHNILFQTSPIEDDLGGSILILNGEPPDRCPTTVPIGRQYNGQTCLYHAETDPMDYPSVAPYLPASDFVVDGQIVPFSSSNFYSGFDQGDSSFLVEQMDPAFAQYLFFSGQKVMPVKKMTVSQNYGCTSFSRSDGKCVYYKTNPDCGRLLPGVPKCKSLTDGTLTYSWHSGLDISGVANTPLYAAESGRVLKILEPGSNNGYGLLTILAVPEQNPQYCLYYAHQNKTAVRVGARVKAGQVIGYMGNTGNSTGVHLHFEVRRYVNGSCSGEISPLMYLGMSGK